MNFAPKFCRSLVSRCIIAACLSFLPVLLCTSQFHARTLEETVTLTYTTGADSDSVSVVDNGRSLKQVGLIVLDGEEISADRLSQLDPSRIDAMTVLKGEQGVERYGEKGAEGVIEITTKKNRSGVAGE